MIAHKVIFLPSGKTIDVDDGTRLYDAAKSAGLPVASSCRGEFTCGKCVMQIVSGGENVSVQDEEERTLLVRERNDPTHRISCHTLVRGACTVTTTYW
ncbi:MAG: 2Fe-2S iron-sulfur cluster binding domain-containing protein [Deltaproteobacteria bacterium]|nr:2Fe-2S iron-sulfur cluster binding domain-containing protein [Deltaproteobacteria bacterium]MBI3295084.1 2Fe-2S iron-sulfur cluster binding domain-containing protein [Deltaproteobacteria bacterium]